MTRQLQLLEPFNVLAVGWWAWGGGVYWHQKLVGQVTKCRTLDGVTFYVRENCNAIPSFYMNAGQRWGDKIEGVGDGRQTLELCAVAAEWDRIAELVTAADAKSRPVRLNKQFNAADAELCLDVGPFGGSANDRRRTPVRTDERYTACETMFREQCGPPTEPIRRDGLPTRANRPVRR
ncbi:MAG: hypothetical protein C0483_18515 [Pirellula sp.]|nr:hypothetical protein [Pirellula sp.]